MTGSGQPVQHARGWRVAPSGRSRRVALAVWAITLGLSLIAVVLIMAGRSADVGHIWGFRGFAVLFALTFGTVGALINTRVPGNRIGYLFALIGVLSAVQDVIAAYVVYGVLVSPGSLPGATSLAWVVSWNWVPLAGIGTTFLLLLFPTGHLLSPRWRPAAWLAVAGIVITALALAFLPGPITNAPYLDNPLGLAGDREAMYRLTALGFLVLATAIALAAASMVVRFRRAVGVERAQLKWFASAGVFAGIVFIGPGTLFNVGTGGVPGTTGSKASEILTIIALASIPIAAGVAILRYRLYDIDRIVSRTIAYAVVTGILIAVFTVVVIGLQALLDPVTSGQTIAVAGSTLVVLAIFQPVLRRVRSAVDRRFYRARYDAERTAASFSERLRHQVDLGAVTADLASTAHVALAPQALGVWLRRESR